MEQFKLENIRCIACESRKIKSWLKDNSIVSHGKVNTFKIFECMECGLGFLNPVPEDSLLASFYSKDYFCYVANPKENVSKLKSFFARNRYNNFLNKRASLNKLLLRLLSMLVEMLTGRYFTYTLSIPLQLDKSNKIIDIGYGSGGWLMSMRKLEYRDLCGYDIAFNSETADKLSVLDINIFNTIDELKSSQMTFDLVRLEHVLEHHKNPNDLLNLCHALLKPNGILVLTVPSKENIAAYYGREKNTQLDIPRHIFHFTPLALEKTLIRNSKFNVISIKKIPVFIENLATFIPEWKDLLVTRILTLFLSPFYAIYNIIFNKSDLITAVLKKN